MSFDNDCVFIACNGITSIIVSLNILTTNATPTILTVVPVATNNVIFIESHILGVRTSGLGLPGDSYAYTAKTKIKNVSGIITVLSPHIITFSDSPLPTISYTVSGTNININVIGIAGTNITWKGEHQLITSNFP